MEVIDALKAVLEWLGIKPTVASLIITGVSLLTLLGSFLGFILKIWSGIKLRRKQKTLFLQLSKTDYSNSDISSHTKNYIPTRFTTNFEEGQSLMYDSLPKTKRIIGKKRLKLIPYLVKRFTDKRNDQKYYLILGDAGMGKTTFTLNLFLAVHKIRRSFFSSYELTPYVFPAAGRIKDLSHIDKIKNPETAVIIIDALDEYSENAEDTYAFFKLLLERVKAFAQVIITCRTQFFSTEESQSPEFSHKTMGRGYEHELVYYYLLPFNNKDVNLYLIKRFPPYFLWNLKKFIKAHKAIRKVPYLALRPMLLDHISYLQDLGNTFQFSFEVYHVLVEKWIDREALKIFSQKNSAREKYVRLLFLLCRKIAITMYNRKEMDYTPSTPGLEALDKDLVETLSRYGDNIDKISFGHLKKNHTYRSLLNRYDDNKYKFSHRSIFEYFIALELRDNLVMFEKFEFSVFSMAKVFFDEYLVCQLQKMKTPYLKDANGDNTTRLTVRDLPHITSLEINTFNENLFYHVTRIPALRTIKLYDFENLVPLYALYKLIKDNETRFEIAAARLIRETVAFSDEELMHFFNGVGIQRKFMGYEYMCDCMYNTLMIGLAIDKEDAERVRDQRQAELDQNMELELAQHDRWIAKAATEERKKRLISEKEDVKKNHDRMTKQLEDSHNRMLSHLDWVADKPQYRKYKLVINEEIFQEVKYRVIDFLSTTAIGLTESLLINRYDNFIIRLQTKDPSGKEMVLRINRFFKSIQDLKTKFPEATFYY